MKRRIAWILATASGAYLLIAGPLPDPLPLIDEATAALIFLKSMAYLGYDVARFLPFLRKGGKKPASPARSAGSAKGQTIDV